MKNCMSQFVLNSVLHVTGSAEGTVVIEDSTLLGGRHHASAGKANVFNFTASTHCNIIVKNSILGGKLDHSLPPDPPDANLSDLRNNNVFAFLGENHLELHGAAFIGEGPYAFRASATGDFLGFEQGTSATLTGAPTTYADPMFVNVAYTDPLNPDFLDVSNDAYANADWIGGPLSGAGDYVGTLARVNEWSLY